MRLEQGEKELAAIGASIGANCRPCIEHHLPAGREAGLSEPGLADAVAAAQAVRQEAIELFTARVDELLGRAGPVPEPGPVADRSRATNWSPWGRASGPIPHPLLDLHITTALEAGLGPTEVEAALKMAEYVQERAAEMTAEKPPTSSRRGALLQQQTAAGN